MSPNVDELVDDLLADFQPGSTPAQEFLGEQLDRGLAWLHFPVGSGGLGLTPDQQMAQSAARGRRSGGCAILSATDVRFDHRHPRDAE
jgi:hypothetical protein